MKKFMMLIIALIPVVLIFAIQLTSVYVGETQYVAVEQVLFEENKKTINKLTSDDVVLSYPAKVLPMTSSNKNIDYHSSNTDIATVNKDGTILFHDFGEVIITAKSSETNAIQDIVTFFVTDTKPHKVEILNKIDTLTLNKTHLLQTKITPNEAENKDIVFVSSNPDVISVSPVGLLTAKSHGKATITAYTDYSNQIYDSFEVEVFVPVTGIEIEQNKNNYTTALNDAQFPTINFVPTYASNQTVTYSVKDNNPIATINNLGEITFLSSGTATFIATSVDGEFTTEFTTTYTGGYVISASMEPKQITAEYQAHLSFDLNITKYPANALDKNIVFSSSNPNVAIVEDGKIKIMGGGSATITMTAYTNTTSSITAYCYVDISRKAEEIIIFDNDVNVSDGVVQINSPTYILNYQVLPVDQTEIISFSNNNSPVATVNSSGAVTFSDPGQARITINAGETSQSITLIYSPPGAQKKEITQDEQTVVINHGESLYFTFADELNMQNVEYYQPNETYLIYDEQNKTFSSTTKTLGGTCTIKATSSLGHYISINVIIVKEAVGLAIDISSNIPQSAIQGTSTIITAQSKLAIKGSAIPSDATTIEGTSPTVKYSTSDTSIATIDQEGNIEFIKAGTIFVSIRVSNIPCQYKITSSFGQPTQFTASLSNTIFEDKGETKQIEISNFMPVDYDFKWQNVIFYNYNPKVISVSSEGIITALDAGTTSLIVKIGDITQTISNIVVKVKTTAVNFVYNNSTLTGGQIIGESLQLSSSVTPSNATNKNVSYSLITNTDNAWFSTSTPGLLEFKPGCEDCAVTIRVTTQDSGVYTDITINKISTPTNFTLLYNEMLLSEYFANDQYEENIIKILPNESATFHVVAGGSGLLDPENIKPENIVVNYNNTDGLSLSVTPNQTDKSYITFKRNDSVLKSIGTQISFSYGNALQVADIKFYKITDIETPGLSNETNKVGLEQKRVFGNKSFYYGWDTNSGGNAHNMYDLVDFYIMPWKAYPEGISDALYWFSDKPNIVSFPDVGYIRINMPSDSAEVVVNVTIGNEPNLANCTVTHTYTFTFVNGVNIFDYNGYKYCLLQDLDIVLQTDMGTAEEGFSGNHQFGYFYHQGTLYEETAVDPVHGGESGLGYDDTILNSAIYGNGHFINFNYIVANGKTDLCFNKNLFNVVIKGRNEDTSKESYKLAAVISATTVPTKCYYTTFQYFDNVYPTHWQEEGHSTIVKLTNCLIRHNSVCGILLGGEVFTQLYLENMIFYDTGNCAININTSEANVFIKGFFDVYNFKKYNEFSEKTYQEVIKKVYSDKSALTDYIDRSSGSVDSYVANVAIFSIGVGSFIGTPKPKASVVYFYDKDQDTYLANTDNCTGLNYAFVESPTVSYLVVTKIKMNMWLCKYNVSEDIAPGKTPNINKLYRATN